MITTSLHLANFMKFIVYDHRRREPRQRAGNFISAAPNTGASHQLTPHGVTPPCLLMMREGLACHAASQADQCDMSDFFHGRRQLVDIRQTEKLCCHRAGHINIALAQAVSDRPAYQSLITEDNAIAGAGLAAPVGTTDKMPRTIFMVVIRQSLV